MNILDMFCPISLYNHYDVAVRGSPPGQRGPRHQQCPHGGARHGLRRGSGLSVTGGNVHFFIRETVFLELDGIAPKEYVLHVYVRYCGRFTYDYA